MIQKHASSSQLAPHQFFVNTSQRQLWSSARLETVKANLAGSLPSHGAHEDPTAVVSAPDDSLYFFFRESTKEMSIPHFPLPIYIYFGRESLCIPLFSTLISLIQMFSPAGCFLSLEVQNTCLIW